MNKRFNAKDKIELGLHNYAAEYYYLKYRFVPKKVWVRILWFNIQITIRDRWHVLRLYKSTCMPEIDPDEDVLWRHVTINITDNADIKHYKNMKNEIHTYEDLDKTYNITLREKQYEIDKISFKMKTNT